MWWVLLASQSYAIVPHSYRVSIVGPSELSNPLLGELSSRASLQASVVSPNGSPDPRIELGRRGAAAAAGRGGGGDAHAPRTFE